MRSTVPVQAAPPVRAKDLLRFITCGSVDVGKSTLMGRLLHDAQLVSEDQLEDLAAESARYGTTGKDLDFALLMDGLEAEREQGITIDVAHRFFSTARRSFIVADTPGHEQYVRNMATGASTAQLAILVVDPLVGLSTQTRRHSIVCSLLGVRHIVLAVNKMDAIAFQRDPFDRITGDYQHWAVPLGFASIQSIPISARYGDNITASSDNTPWYRGLTLLSYLETIQVDEMAATKPFRFHVQWVNRPHPAFRGYAGSVASGILRKGDPVVVAGSGARSHVEQIITYDGSLERAEAGDAVTLTLVDDIDIARGNILAAPAALPEVADQFTAHIMWMDQEPMMPGRSYLARLGTQLVPLSVTGIRFKLDVDTGAHLAARALAQNDIAFCNVSTGAKVAFDAYSENRATGCFIMIDRLTNRTVGAGMIAFALRRGSNVQWQDLLVGKRERAALKNQKPAILWLTGLSGAGKSTIANLVERRLHAMGCHTMLLDGDNVRYGLNRDLGFTEADRVENIRRAGEVAKLLTESGLIVVCSFISPYQAEREMVRGLVATDEFIEIFIDTPLDECMRRDPKGLYEKAQGGQIKNLTGWDAPYEAPKRPEMHLRTVEAIPEELAERIIQELARRALIARP